MSGLVISLKPNEKFLVNGALLCNGNKRGQICVPGNNVFILRMTDAIHPNDVTTPIRRLYYSVQLILSYDSSPLEMHDKTLSQLDALIKVLSGTPVEGGLQKARTAFAKGRYYSVLYALKSMLEFEDQLLSRNSAISDLDMTIPVPGARASAPEQMIELAE